MNRLYKSNDDKKLFGICGGIAQFLQIDSTLVRLGLVLFTVFTGFPVLIYLLMVLIVPKDPGWAYGYGRAASEYPFPHLTLDEEMERIEKRALQEEVLRLRAELARLRQGEQTL